MSLIRLAAALVIVGLSVQCQDGQALSPLIVVKTESDWEVPLREYVSNNDVQLQSEIKVVGGGSARAIGALIDGHGADGAITMRQPNGDERAAYRERMPGGSLDEVLLSRSLGFVRMALIVNPANRIAQIHRRDLVRIYSGEIERWSLLAPSLMVQTAPPSADRIEPILQEPAAGAVDVINKAVFNYSILTKQGDVITRSPNLLFVKSNQDVIDYVAQTPGALGFVLTHTIDDQVRRVPITNLWTLGEIGEPLLERSEGVVLSSREIDASEGFFPPPDDPLVIEVFAIALEDTLGSQSDWQLFWESIMAGSLRQPLTLASSRAELEVRRGVNP